MDKVKRLLDEISRIPELRAFKAGRLLNDVAEIYERHGAGVTRAYLLNRKAEERGLLIKIIDKLEACPDTRSNRAIGRQIIKCLFELRKGAST